MKAVWKEKQVGAVLQLEYGKPLDDRDRKPDGLYPVYGANGEKDRTDKFYFDKPTIIVGRKGSAGELNLTEPKFWPLDVSYFVTFDEQQHDLRFLYYLLTTLDLPSLAKGVKPGINRNEVYSQITKIPPLPEQQRIVGLLDEAFEGIATAKANAEKNLQNAHALFESHLQSVFTQRGKEWVEKRLEEIGKTQTGSTPKTSDQSNYGDFISFVKPADFNADGSLDYAKDGLSKTGLANARVVPAGSVLMVCIGATIGKCGYCEQDVTTNQQINALTPNDGSSHRFLYYQMLTESFQRSVIHRSGQATLPIINKSKWSTLLVWLPPTVAEQKRIAAKFDALVEETQRLASLYERKLAALEALTKSLLHQAFTGQL
jgi:restriction endonuclease S subunit